MYNAVRTFLFVEVDEVDTTLKNVSRRPWVVVARALSNFLIPLRIRSSLNYQGSTQYFYKRAAHFCMKHWCLWRYNIWNTNYSKNNNFIIVKNDVIQTNKFSLFNKKNIIQILMQIIPHFGTKNLSQLNFFTLQ